MSSHPLLNLSTTKGGDTLAGFAYTLDVVGNRTGITYADGSSSSYEYDNAYRLTMETRTRAEDATARWKLDESTGSSAAGSAGPHTGTLPNFPTDDSQWVTGKLSISHLSGFRKQALISAASERRPRFLRAPSAPLALEARSPRRKLLASAAAYA